MNTDRLLDLIFRLARRAPVSAIAEMPYGLETAVLAHWSRSRRASLGERRTAAWLALGRVGGLCGRPAHRCLEK